MQKTKPKVEMEEKLHRQKMAAKSTEILERYIERTPKSRTEYEKAKKLIPGGVGSGVQIRTPYPIYVAYSKGSRVWDLDGNEYIDFSMCFAAMIAGHAHPAIVDAIRRQIERGTLYGMPSVLASELVLELQRRYPMLEMVRFTQSGVEAVTYALRVARAATRKSKFVKVEGAYHGGMDELFVSTQPPIMEMAGPAWDPTPVLQTEGARSDAAEHVLVVPFNDIEAMERKLAQHKDEVACVILEPIMTNGGVIPPVEDYLRDVRYLTRKYNVLMILDEVKTGCRVAPGGACELYHIQPDLVTLAKAIGGGTSLGAFGGRADLMGLIAPNGPVFHAGTYNANPLVMAAGLACLQEVLTLNAYKHINGLGTQLAQGQRELITKHGLPACVTHVGPLGGLIFTPETPKNYREARRCNQAMWTDYWFSMLNRGVIPMGCAWFEEWSISVTHSSEDIVQTLEATDETFAEIAAQQP